jgi:hypothetical protein
LDSLLVSLRKIKGPILSYTCPLDFSLSISSSYDFYDRNLILFIFAFLFLSTSFFHNHGRQAQSKADEIATAKSHPKFDFS